MKFRQNVLKRSLQKLQTITTLVEMFFVKCASSHHVEDIRLKYMYGFVVPHLKRTKEAVV